MMPFSASCSWLYTDAQRGQQNSLVLTRGGLFERRDLILVSRESGIAFP
jgi:hypothetical protein